MRFEMAARVMEICPPQQISERYSVRLLRVEDRQWGRGPGGVDMVTEAEVQFANERMTMLDGISQGEVVKISGVITSRRSRTGHLFYSLKGLNIQPWRREEKMPDPTVECYVRR